SAFAVQDYQSASGDLTFDPGVTDLPIIVYINGTTELHPDLMFLVVLSDPVNATLAVDTGSFTILSNMPFNHPPVVTVPGFEDNSMDEDGELFITGISVSDPDAGDAPDFQVTLRAQHGTLTLRTDVAGGLVDAQNTGNGTALVTATATLAQ